MIVGPFEKIVSILSSVVKPLTSPDNLYGQSASRSSVSPTPGKPQASTRADATQLTAQKALVCT